MKSALVVCLPIPDVNIKPAAVLFIRLQNGLQLTRMNDPAMVEEGGSERDSVREGFNSSLDYCRFFVEHGLKVRPNDLRHQHLMFSVGALHLEMVQESKNVIGSRMCP